VKVHDVYENYLQSFCHPQRQEPKGKSAFGKTMRAAFPKLLRRRLGPAGLQEAYYCGIVLILEQLQPPDELAVEEPAVRTCKWANKATDHPSACRHPVAVLLVTLETQCEDIVADETSGVTTFSSFFSSLLWDQPLPGVYCCWNARIVW